MKSNTQTARNCIHCHKTKPISSFRKNANQRGGYTTACKDCLNATARKKRENSPGKIKERYLLDLENKGMALCQKCQKEKQKTEFYGRKGASKDVASRCKSCTREDAKQERRSDEYKNRLADLEELEKSGLRRCTKCQEAKDKECFAKSGKGEGKLHAVCRDCMRLYGQQWYQNNLEQKKQKNREWGENNKDKVAVLSHRWYEANKDKNRIKRSRRRALEEGADGSFTKEQFEALCNFYGPCCLRCGQVRSLTIDHVIPLTKGGNNKIENIQPICRSCNSSKRNHHNTDYRPDGGDFARRLASGQAA